MSEDESAIRELVATWMAASKAGDLDTVLSLMADDVIFMVPGREPFGKEEFAAASRSMTDVRIEGASDIQEIEVFGDWAYLHNRLTITMTPAGGQAMLRRIHALDPAQGGGRALAARARREFAGETTGVTSSAWNSCVTEDDQESGRLDALYGSGVCGTSSACG